MGLDMVRFSISMPEWKERKLRLWAMLKGTNRATLAANIVQARLEANWEAIEAEIREIAAHQGKTYEELVAEWLSEDAEK